MTQIKSKAQGDYDWQSMYARLAASQGALEAEALSTPAVKREILHRRALELASPMEKPTADRQLELLEFVLAYESYAVESRYVREVYPLTEITALPGTPAFVLGIINLRGEIVSVVDLKKFFDLPQRGLTDLNKVIILHDDNMEFGILADAIIGIRDIALGDIKPAQATLSGIHIDYLHGVTESRLVVLDGKKILADEKMVVDQGEMT